MMRKALVVFIVVSLALIAMLSANAQSPKDVSPPLPPLPSPVESTGTQMPDTPDNNLSTYVSRIPPVDLVENAKDVLWGEPMPGVRVDGTPTHLALQKRGTVTEAEDTQYQWSGIYTLPGQNYRIFEEYIYLGDIHRDPNTTCVRIAPHLIPQAGGDYLAFVLDICSGTPPGKVELQTYYSGTNPQFMKHADLDPYQWYRFQINIGTSGPPYNFNFFYANWNEALGNWEWHWLRGGNIDSKECWVENMLEHVWDIGGGPSVHGYAHEKNMWLWPSNGGPALAWDNTLGAGSLHSVLPLNESVSMNTTWPPTYRMGLWSNYQSLNTNFLSGWDYFSFPLSPNPATWDPGEQLGDDLPTPLLIWRYVAGTQQWETYYTGSGGFPPDIGQHGFAVFVSGNRPVDGVGHMAEYNDFEIPLSYAWNLVGHPFAFIVDKKDLMVKYGGQKVSWQQAVANGWVYDIIQWYDPQIGGYVNVNEFDPWRGCWVRAQISGCTLIVPPVVHSQFPSP